MIIIIYIIICFTNFYIFVSLIDKFLKVNKKIVKIKNKINLCYLNEISNKKIIRLTIIFLSHFTFFALAFNVIFIQINIRYTFVKIIITLFVYFLFYYIYGYGLLNSKSKKEYAVLMLLINSYSLLVFTSVQFVNILRNSNAISKALIFIGYIIMYCIFMKEILSYAFNSIIYRKGCCLYIYYLTGIIYILFLGSCMVEIFYKNSYTGVISYFDLLYYTIVTFTTVGFGDIVPSFYQGKIMSIVISITSIITISFSFNRIFVKKGN